VCQPSQKRAAFVRACVHGRLESLAPGHHLHTVRRGGVARAVSELDGRDAEPGGVCPAQRLRRQRELVAGEQVRQLRHRLRQSSRRAGESTKGLGWRAHMQAHGQGLELRCRCEVAGARARTPRRQSSGRSQGLHTTRRARKPAPSMCRASPRRASRGAAARPAHRSGRSAPRPPGRAARQRGARAPFRPAGRPARATLSARTTGPLQCVAACRGEVRGGGWGCDINHTHEGQPREARPVLVRAAVGGVMHQHNALVSVGLVLGEVPCSRSTDGAGANYDEVGRLGGGSGGGTRQLSAAAAVADACARCCRRRCHRAATRHPPPSEGAGSG
jgi:hypothetical protein